MKLVAVNIAFREESFYKRWRLLANDHGFDVTLVGPKDYTYKKFGKPLVFNPVEVSDANFAVRLVNMRQRKWLRNDWWSWKYLKVLIQAKPDIIYLIGYERRNVVFLSIFYKLIFRKNTKIALFTMRGKDMPLHCLESRVRWKLAKGHFDFVNVHYPFGKELIRKQGKYKGPIDLQTQIGVNKDVFFPSLENRDTIRDIYNIAVDEFVFGAAIRIQEAKGVFDIIEACRNIHGKFKFLLLGDGDELSKAQNLVQEYSLEKCVILAGRVQSGAEVAMHMNAMDCFVHVPKTTKAWVDTFPLAVVQAMACALPVIGSNSGAVPYQIGLEKMIIPEGDIEQLRSIMTYFLNHREEAIAIGLQMYSRVINTFEIRHLNSQLAKTFQSLVAGDTFDTLT